MIISPFHLNRKRIWILLSCVYAVAPINVLALPTIEDVIAGIVANDNSIQTYSVESHTRIDYLTPRPMIPESEEYNAKIWVKGSLYRYEKEGYFIYRQDHPLYNLQGKEGRFDQKRMNAYDGMAEKEVNFIEKVGYVREIRGARAVPSSHPMFFGISMSEFPAFSRRGLGIVISPDTYSVVGTAVIDGHTVLKIEGANTEGHDFKEILLIDPARSYRLVKKILCSTTDPYEVMNVDEFKDFTEVANGIFLPTLIQTTTSQIDRETEDKIIYTSQTTTLNVKTLEINTPRNDSFFSIDFPRGWPVYDEIVGRKYIADQILSDNEAENIVSMIQSVPVIIPDPEPDTNQKLKPVVTPKADVIKQLPSFGSATTGSVNESPFPWAFVLITVVAAACLLALFAFLHIRPKAVKKD